MNGRIYDATIGRFLQADPNIDGTTSVGGFNRYAYVHNNPLNATDPSGYFLKKLFKNKIFQMIVVAALAVVTYGAVLGALTMNGCLMATTGMLMQAGAVSGFVAGAAGTLMAGGSVKEALKAGVIGAVSGAAFAGIGQAFGAKTGLLKAGGAGHVLAHGMAGGVSNVLQGGKFGHGFISAGFAKFSAVNWTSKIGGDSMGAILGRTSISAMVGGTVSAATGGKFANGARTAALAHLVNQESSKLVKRGADLNYGRRGKKLGNSEVDEWEAGQRLQRDPDEFVVLAHGNPKSMTLRYPVDAEGLAERIVEGGWKPGQPIRLVSCNTGRTAYSQKYNIEIGGDTTVEQVVRPGIAEQLSNVLNTSVTAPLDFVTVCSAGNITGVNEYQNGRGKDVGWVTYDGK